MTVFNNISPLHMGHPFIRVHVQESHTCFCKSIITWRSTKPGPTLEGYKMGERSACMCICVSSCVAVSLHHTHPSLLPFATWPVNYLFLFTHAHKENKPLSDCLNRLHSPLSPLSNISLFCGPKAAFSISALDPSSFHRLWPRSGCREVQPELTSRWVRDFSNCQKDVFVTLTWFGTDFTEIKQYS